MCKVVGYVRVSTENQSKEGYSVESQQDEIREYCQKNGWDLLRIYVDEAISGACADEEELTVDRPGLQDMLADLRDADIRYVVTRTTNRLWRSDITKVLIQRELKRKKVDVRAIDRPTYSIYETDPSAVLINGMMELLDTYERLEIALKLKRGRHKKAQKGGYAGGGAPIGYKAERDSRRLHVDEDKAFTVKRVFELREAYPTATLQQMADRLNIEGHTTAKGTRWMPMQVKRVLDREDIYRGSYFYAGIKSNGRQTPIL